MIHFKKLNRFLASSGILAGILLVGCTEPPLHKSDRSLEDTLKRSQDQFSRLVSMVEHDQFHILSINLREMEPSGIGLPPGRLDDYVNICKDVGIVKIERLPDRVVLISTIESRDFGLERRKGYVYSKEPLSPVVATLNDEIPSEYVSNSKGVAYKRLNQAWYLFMQQD